MYPSCLLFPRAAQCLIVAAVSFATVLPLAADESTDVLKKARETYSSGGEVRVKPAFLPLPAGAVSPKDWLRDWAITASKGITGHLDEYSSTFGEAWKGHGFEARGANPDGTGWPLEQSSYWLDGAVRLAWILDDAALKAKVAKRLDLVVSGVLNGGPSFIYWRPKAAVDDTFNSWAHSHMGRALVAYYQATGDPRVLKALVTVYREFPLPDMRSTFDDVSGANNIDAMVDTYLMSGDRAVLARVVEYSRRAAYRDLAAKWLSGRLEPGHNVIFYENARVPALLFPWTGNRDDLEASKKALAWSDEHNLLPMGLDSGEEFHAGIGATRNVETCNVAASIWTYLWLLRITGTAEDSDRIERIFFNAGPAPVDRDFRTMCYYQSANRYSSSNPSEEPQNPGAKAYQFTNIGHPVLCCVGNLNRVIPSYVMHMWMATLDGGLAATLYGPSSVRAKVADDVPVTIDSATSYPFEESVALTVRPQRPVAFPLSVRVPSWCRAPDVRVNGKKIAALSGGSFVRIARTWRDGDKVTLHFPMPVEVIRGRETSYPKIPYFQQGRRIARDTASGSPWASVRLGPLLFSLPIPDETANRETPNARFGYALDVRPEQASDDVSMVRRAMPAHWQWQLDSPVQLSVKVREFDWRPAELQPLPKEPVKGGLPAKVMLVPYGCTKFRISMFPVTE